MRPLRTPGEESPSPKGAPSGPSGQAAPDAPYVSLGWGLALILIWLAAHPYVGVIHDARFYTVQALNMADRGRFAVDLFFAYGSQDSFTAFTAPYSLLVHAAGPAAAHAIASAIGQTLWFGALVVLAQALFANRLERLVAIAAVILLDRHYGASGVFNYSEPFVTPRLYAEALVLGALALCLRRRFIAAGAGFGAAVAIHPLMGLTGLAVIASIVLLKEKRAWIAVGLAGVAVVVLALSGVEPFGRLLKQLDPAWAAIVEQRSSYSFLARWSWADWLSLAAAFASLAAFLCIATAKERRFTAAILLVSFAALAASWLGGDLAKNVLIVNLQPWRALWLATIAANAAVALIVVRTPKDYVSREFFIVGGILSVIRNVFWMPDFIGSSVLLIATLILLIEWRRRSPINRWAATALRIAIIPGLVIAGYLIVQRLQSPNATPVIIFLVVVGGALVSLRLLHQSRPRVFALVFICLLTLQLVNLDHRSDWQKFVEDPQASPSLAALALKPNTYWEAGVELLWLKLNKPSYYSCAQGTGVMFYRDTAMEYARRGDALRKLNTYDFKDKDGELCTTKLRPGKRGPEDRAQLVEACRLLPELDTMVLSRRVASVPAEIWRAPVPRPMVLSALERPEVSIFYVYRCEDLRKSKGAV